MTSTTYNQFIDFEAAVSDDGESEDQDDMEEGTPAEYLLIFLF